ncbi:MAG: hypothetical protein CHKLHMKO_00568 [Candidatus Argoarchaeum ethanivorans]|uniref:Uncharacterized protein n=1 Tax=Candidatus Argoarchaeum ethanivorans TaxID=2608793 RepID=A0A811TC20_9EURY|nr:MAG: hypothetical protein CHKLHMKO_00568 [Candidatus Argoarchaeum ethanivorans]
MIKGEQDWALKQFNVASGTHELKWQYSKDGSQSIGSDTGWVDPIIVRKYTSPEPTTSVSATEEYVGGDGEDPVPELPTIILFSIGLLVLAGYVVLKRRI